MKRNKEKQMILIILLGILLLLIILVSIMGKVKNSGNEKITHYTEEDEFTQIGMQIYEEQKKEMIKPNGIFQLNKKYNGRVDLDEFYMTIKSVYDGILDSGNIADETLEVTNLDELKQYISVKDLEAIEVGPKAEIKTTTIEYADSGIQFDMTLNFVDESLSFKVYLANYSVDQVIAKYTFEKSN